jgi:hypothetical protein
MLRSNIFDPYAFVESHFHSEDNGLSFQFCSWLRAFALCAFFTVDFLGGGCASSSLMRSFGPFISCIECSDFLFQKFCTRHELPQNLVFGRYGMNNLPQ